MKLYGYLNLFYFCFLFRAGLISAQPAIANNSLHTVLQCASFHDSMPYCGMPYLRYCHNLFLLSCKQAQKNKIVNKKNLRYSLFRKAFAASGVCYVRRLTGSVQFTPEREFRHLHVFNVQRSTFNVQRSAFAKNESSIPYR